MTTATAKTNRVELLDTLTTAVTAFTNWAEFKAAMQGGYCPTLRTVKVRKNASRKQKTYEKAVKMLRVMVRAEGFKVFDGRAVS